jgi:hypothetical protein
MSLVKFPAILPKKMHLLGGIRCIVEQLSSIDASDARGYGYKWIVNLLALASL